MLKFAVLASGSAGNAALLQAGSVGVLIDPGIGPRQLAARLRAIGASWDDIHVVLLTHTHSDHWRERTLEQLVRRRIPFWCHPAHAQMLASFSAAFQNLQAARLVRPYQQSVAFGLSGTLHCTPLEVAHDSYPTFAFRFSGSSNSSDNSWQLGYLSDLGCWTPALAEAFRDVDILALEFNHCETLERQSRRPIELIERVLGDLGHLSNAQAAAFLAAILGNSAPNKLRHLVQLHLSRDCNRPLLAQQAAARACRSLPAPPQIHTACQDQAGPLLSLEATGTENENSTAPVRQPEATTDFLW